MIEICQICVLLVWIAFWSVAVGSTSSESVPAKCWASYTWKYVLLGFCKRLDIGDSWPNRISLHFFLDGLWNTAALTSLGCCARQQLKAMRFPHTQVSLTKYSRTLVSQCIYKFIKQMCRLLRWCTKTQLRSTDLKSSVNVCRHPQNRSLPFSHSCCIHWRKARYCMDCEIVLERSLMIGFSLKPCIGPSRPLHGS